MLTWHNLTAEPQIEQIEQQSYTTPCLIFKHSTRCSISNTALQRLQRQWNLDTQSKLIPYYLDLLQHRTVSNHVAQKFEVEHQSPQILLISKGRCIFSQSQLEINMAEISEQLSLLPINTI